MSGKISLYLTLSIHLFFLSKTYLSIYVYLSIQGEGNKVRKRCHEWRNIGGQKIWNLKTAGKNGNGKFCNEIIRAKI